jgi:hypothetical protein
VIRDALPIMARNMVAPFLKLDRTNHTFGAEKWWLRCPGAPSFLLLMRTVTVFLEGAKKLRAEKLLIKKMREILDLELPVKENKNFDKTSQLGSYLSVQVKRQGEVKASVRLPVRAVKDLESLLEEEVIQKIRALGVNLRTISQKAVESGYRAQVLFEGTLGEKELRVWIA